MFQNKSVAVVVPAYNEEAHIEQVLRTMPAWVDRIWVVDDGSTDRTADVVHNMTSNRVRLIRHQRRLGVGAAIAKGYQHAFSPEEKTDITCVMAGDGQMDPADLPSLIEPVASGTADYVKGNRFRHHDARRIPRSRALGNHVLSWMTRRQTGLRISDAQCGYTAMAIQAAHAIDLGSLWPSYGYPNQLLAYMAKARLRVAEVTVRPVYGAEQSHLRLHHALLVVPWVILRGPR